MTILYDGFIYACQAHGGINRYFSEVIGRLPREHRAIVASGAPLMSEPPTRPGLKIRRLRVRDFRPWKLARALDSAESWIKTRLPLPDVFHPTYYTPSHRPMWERWSGPMVVTVWDMIHELFAAEMDPTGAAAREKLQVIQRADAIVCISENTKNDLMNHVDLADKAVSVCHLASNLTGEMASGDEPVPDAPYVLYVGTRWSYKNFECLVRAFAALRSRGVDLRLSLAGPPFTDEESAALSRRDLLRHIDHWGHVSDTHLAKLYRCARAFVYPSRYEGFGIPVLDAMACGTPVVASNRASIPEVAGDAAILFDPDSADELVSVLVALARDETRRRELIDRGARRAAEFDWQRATGQTLSAYSGAIERHAA